MRMTHRPTDKLPRTTTKPRISNPVRSDKNPYPAVEALLERIQRKEFGFRGMEPMDAMMTMKFPLYLAGRKKETSPSAKDLDGRILASVASASSASSTIITKNRAICRITDAADGADAKLHSLPGIERLRTLADTVYERSAPKTSRSPHNNL